jgi:formylmethanofuran dehydrogenase subunit E-like metal-binding protein
MSGAVSGAAAQSGLAQTVAQVVAQIKERLGPLDNPASMACLTNAGYALYQGASTRPVYDLLPKLATLSLGRGNLMVRPGRAHEPLFFMFIKKQGPDKLMMSYWPNQGKAPRASSPLNIVLNEGSSLEPSKKVLDDMAFNLVTLANGWAMGLPEDIMRGALNHGHLCCGVFTGYFTARFIEKNITWAPGDKLTYIGAPAWCQDDYLTDYLRVTPGTRGYFTMAYPWSRAWKAKSGVFAKLGGVVLRWNPKTKRGVAYVLSFDWRIGEFRRTLTNSDVKLDWQGQPWLHMAYNRFFLKHLSESNKFVSILRQKEIEGQAQYAQLVNLGANPLAVILGPDQSYRPNALGAGQ